MGEKANQSNRSRVLVLVTYLVSIASLYWALRDAQLGELKDDLASMNWGWVTIAAAANVGVYLWQAVRWQCVLRPVARLGYWETARAIFVGLFANEVLPLRAGEVLRCYMLSRNVDLPVSVTLASALIERIIDGIWLCACLFLMLHYIPLPRGFRFLVDGGYALGVTVAVIAVVLSLALFHRHKTHTEIPEKGWRRQLHILITDLEMIGHSRYLWIAFFQSLPLLLAQTLPVLAAFYGYGFDLSLGTAFALMIILRLGSAVPQAPGNLGLSQFLAREALDKIFNVVPAEAARFSLVLWGIVTIPLLIGGVVALAVAGLRLKDLHRDAQTDAARR